MTIHPDLTELAQKIFDRSLTLGIIGLAYVGLPFAKGIKVIGYDLDQAKIDKIAAGKAI